MRGTAPVVRRDLNEKKLVLLSGLLIGIMTLTPMLRSGGSEDVVAVAADFVGRGLAYAAAFFGGASTIGRDLSERRMSFYFARPLRSAEIFAGKLISAGLVSILLYALVLTPATLLGGGIFYLLEHEKYAGPQYSYSPPLWISLMWVAGLCTAGHAAGIAFRSRSSWVGRGLAGSTARLRLARYSSASGSSAPRSSRSGVACSQSTSRRAK